MPCFYPPPPHAPWVVALGTLRGAPPPTKGEVELAMFLFGVEPPSPLNIAKPTGLAAREEVLLICDTALRAVFRWDGDSGEIREERYRPPLERPFAIDLMAGGDRLICDGGAVVRVGPAGQTVLEYTLAADAFKPGGVLAVGDEVWVTNLASHRIEVFDAASGAHRRSIGEQGRGPGRFAMPHGLARTPEGNVCVVDTLNGTVQVLDVQGNWLSEIGRPGDRVGTFGRPRAVAVGPDGTVFVSDAYTQRVHAFAPDGAPLLAFGEPGSGVGELALPSGVAVTDVAPQADHELPADIAADYYVLVAEQLQRPGVRVYAWLGEPEPEAVAVKPPGADAMGPHWDPESCEACHDEGDEGMEPIALEDVNEVCLDCHEEHEDTAWEHPVDAVVAGPRFQEPGDWPLNEGQLTCVTCHDIKRQCGTDARRPAVNTVLLRAHEPRSGFRFCVRCHLDIAAWSAGPHGQVDEEGRPNTDSCVYCHTEVPTVPDDGTRRLEPGLHNASGSCLTCHSQHWDYFSDGHFARPVPPRIRQRMLERELGRRQELSAQEVRALAEQADRRPTRLPLGDDGIACYTCHNPHEAGLFPPDSELATRATAPRDAAYLLRVDRPMLCLECHDK